MPSEADIYAQANAGETAYPVPLGTLDSLPYDLTASRDQKKQAINDAAAEYGPGVEAARMSAIQAIDEAETIPAVFADEPVDWEAALPQQPDTTMVDSDRCPLASNCCTPFAYSVHFHIYILHWRHLQT